MSLMSRQKYEKEADANHRAFLIGFARSAKLDIFVRPFRERFDKTEENERFEAAGEPDSHVLFADILQSGQIFPDIL